MGQLSQEKRLKLQTSTILFFASGFSLWCAALAVEVCAIYFFICLISVFNGPVVIVLMTYASVVAYGGDLIRKVTTYKVKES